MNSKPSSGVRLTEIAIFAVLLLGLLVRLIYFNQLRARFDGFLVNQPFCGLDANAYHNYALGVLEGSWPGDQPFFHMILYPFYLSAFYGWVGVNLRLVTLIQILLEITACAALYGIGRLAFNRAVGLVAAALFAFYGPLIFFNACFAQVALSIPLFALAVFVLLKATTTPRHSYWLLALAGLFTGLAALSRPTFLFLVPIAALWWLIQRVPFKRLLWQTALYAAVVFLFTLPATLHNWRTAGRFSPTPITGWEVLFLGNNPIAEGMGTLDHVLYTYIDVPGERYLQSVIKESGTSFTLYRDEALKFITTQPQAWLRLMGRKSYMLLWERDERLISPYFVHNFNSAPLLRYLPFTWRSVFLGAVLGLLLVKHKHRSLFVMLLGVLILFTLVFHIQYRFRLLLVPLVLLYAAAFVVKAPHLGRAQFGLALVGLALLFPFLPELWWLLALFMASALLPLVQQKNWPVLRWAGPAIWSYFVVAILLSRMMSFATQTGQSQSIFLGPQITGPVAVGQSFVVHCNGFNKLRVVLGTFGDTHGGPMTFHLRAGPNQPDDIYRVNFDIIGVQDRTRREFSFPAQANSAGRSYFFFVDAPSTPPEQAITLRGAFDQPVDRYRQGSAYVGQPGAWQELSADFAFNAYCDVGWLALAGQTFQKLAANLFGSAPFYWGVLVGHVGVLIVALLKLQKLTFRMA